MSLDEKDQRRTLEPHENAEIRDVLRLVAMIRGWGVLGRFMAWVGGGLVMVWVAWAKWKAGN